MNSLVANRTIYGGVLGRPEHLWVAFGDRATAFQKHCLSKVLIWFTLFWKYHTKPTDGLAPDMTRSLEGMILTVLAIYVCFFHKYEFQQCTPFQCKEYYKMGIHTYLFFKTQQVLRLKPSDAELLWQKKITSAFSIISDTENVRVEKEDFTQPIPRLLMTWQCKEPRHQQLRYWLSLPITEYLSLRNATRFNIALEF